MKLRNGMETRFPPRNWLRQLAERLGIPKYSKRNPAIQYDDSGLTVSWYYRDGSTVTTSAKWSEISRAAVYKRDCYTVDLICIGFFASDGSFEIHEQMSGWQGLVEQLPRYLPGTPVWEQWWLEVVHPAFAPNWTLIFAREQTKDADAGLQRMPITPSS